MVSLGVIVLVLAGSMLLSAQRPAGTETVDIENVDIENVDDADQAPMSLASRNRSLGDSPPQTPYGS